MTLLHDVLPHVADTRCGRSAHPDWTRDDLDHQRPAQRRAAIRAGWNDAAWGHTRRERDAALAPWYERGYAGGVLYRQQLKSDLAEADVQASGGS